MVLVPLCSALILSEGSASVIPENLPEEFFFIKGFILEIKLMHVVEYVFHHIDLLILLIHVNYFRDTRSQWTPTGRY
jgi:hypothetical protein